MCGVLIEEKDIDRLKQIGVKDSKLLTPKKREDLFEKIIKIIKKHKVILIDPEEIDKALESEELNLNKLEAIHSARIINYLKPDKVILDCPSVNTISYLEYLKIFLKDKTIKIICEHKAEKYAVVAASSIIAKVTRDREIEKIKKNIGCEIGSGYPADEKTQRFLKENYKRYPEIFRKSWASCKRLIKDGKK